MSELDLSKKLELRKDVVLNLAKSIGLGGQTMQVKWVIDISGSMRGMFDRGVVQKALERFVPISMAFDNDQEMEVYPFHDGVNKCENNCTVNNVSGYIKEEILKRFQFGGTNYAPAINKVMKDFFLDTANVTTTKTSSGGIFGLFKKAEVVTSVAKIPTLILFITDGNCFDESAAEEAIIEAAKHGVFFQFIGLGPDSFSFLRKLDNMKGRFLDNANFFSISERELLESSDLDLYNKLLNELPDWLKAAKQAGIVN